MSKYNAAYYVELKRKELEREQQLWAAGLGLHRVLFELWPTRNPRCSTMSHCSTVRGQ